MVERLRIGARPATNTWAWWNIQRQCPQGRWLQWIDAPDNVENEASELEDMPSDSPGLWIVRINGVWWTMPIHNFLSLLQNRHYELALQLHLAKQHRRRLAWRRLRRTMRPRWRRYTELLHLRRELHRRQPWYLQ